MYSGTWEDNCMNGFGVYSYKDGSRYEGEWQRDVKHGKGKYTWANGKTYDGGWANGTQHGDGEFFAPKTNVTKRGRWENGKRVEWYEEEAQQD